MLRSRAAAVACALALSISAANAKDARPHAWCGWWMRHHLGVSDVAGNLARWWARFGSNAHGPAVGVIVVWKHHVGIVVGRASDGRWIVKSGNDGGRVRERPRSLSGAIAFRWSEKHYAANYR